MLEVSLGTPQRHAFFTVFPLIAEEDRSLPYTLLADALATRSIVIREVGQGTVPTLEVVNQGPQAVLILDGEQLVGAKQNRMVNRSLLIPPYTTLPIPVACMEEGRWHWTSPHFRLSEPLSPSKVRRHARLAEARAFRDMGRSSPEDLVSAQGDVWGEIREISYLLDVDSPTGALDEVWRRREEDLEPWLAAVPAVERQVGLVALAGETILGVDALGSPDLYRPVHQRLVAGYVMDAWAEDAARGGRRRRRRRSRSSAEEVEKGKSPDGEERSAKEEEEGTLGDGSPYLEKALLFMEWLKGSPRRTAETVGLGEYRLLSGKVLGGELIHEGRLVHLSAFPPDGGETATGEGDSSREAQGYPIHRSRRRRPRLWEM